MKLLILLLISSACFAQPKAVPKVTVSGTTATLRADSSTGNIGSVSWTALPAVSFTNGVYYASSINTPVTATIKPGTKYTFILTVQDRGGRPGVTSIDYNPAAAVVVAPPVVVPPAKKIKYEITLTNDDGSIFAVVTLYDDKSVIVK